MRNICKLRGMTYANDGIGNQVGSVTETKIYCDSIPIQQSEIFKAAQEEIKPGIRLKVRTIDFKGQEEVEFKSKIYHIYRTYPQIEYTELYGEVRA